MAQFYVRAIRKQGAVIGYGVYDSVGGMEVEHSVYAAPGDGNLETCLYLANAERDDRNKKIA